MRHFVESQVRAGIGTSAAVDPAEAGREAAAQAMAGLAGIEPALVIVFASSCYDLTALLRSVRAVTGSARVVGATGAGIFTCGSVLPADRGVSVLALTAGPYRYGVASVDTADHADIRAAGMALARNAKVAAGPDLRRHAALLLLTVSFTGDQQALLAGVHQVLGAGVPVVGGSAGDDRSFRRACVLHDDDVLPAGGVAVWIDSDHPLEVAWGHGWQPMSAPRMVTRVDGLTLSELDGHRAMDVFAEEVGATGDLGLAGRYPGQVLTEHPIGIVQPDGSRVVRVLSVLEGDELAGFAPFPLYAPVQVLHASAEDLLGVSESVVAAAVASRTPGVVLGFSCSVRVDALGERIGDEAQRIQAAAGAVPTFGFYGYGEFARSTSVAGYHNASLATVAL